MNLDLEDKVAIITGGSDGIGKAAALSMSREGARVAIAARTEETLAEAASARVTLVRAAIATRAPSRDIDNAAALPIPSLPPVMMATLPSRSRFTSVDPPPLTSALIRK